MLPRIPPDSASSTSSSPNWSHCSDIDVDEVTDFIDISPKSDDSDEQTSNESVEETLSCMSITKPVLIRPRNNDEIFTLKSPKRQKLEDGSGLEIGSSPEFSEAIVEDAPYSFSSSSSSSSSLSMRENVASSSPAEYPISNSTRNTVFRRYTRPTTPPSSPLEEKSLAEMDMEMDVD
jgi:hypothetical protein